MLQDVKSYLGKCFARKDFREAAYVLGIKIYKDKSRRLIGLCHSTYIEKILKVFHMENSKHRSIPIQDKPKLCKSQYASTPVEVKRMQRVPYASVVGSIIIQGNPYWTAIKNILKYLHNIKDMVLVYKGDIKRELRVACYIDARYMKDVDDTKSHSGYIRKFIHGLGVIPINEVPMMMYYDIIKAITITNEPGITKADPFTKALPFNKHSKHTINIGKTKLAYAPKSKIPRLPKKNNPAKDATCHQYGEVGHWRRNCPLYLAELINLKKLSQGASTSGNGHRASLEAIGTFHLCLPSGLVVILNNCHYAPSSTRGIILVSLFKNNGFVNCFIDNGISISKDGLLYFHAIPHDGIYEIDLHRGNSNDSPIYAVSNKRAK
ncbi:retrotransposon protein, putative, ty1-copia subclass [Tanacetum coccineum]|uniref:Retrotransposon protein, putative, ty1-copia subclass n=1 Tax=Tanacetum coccineum TaxID=301880 RepID=A0ABQ5BWG5_9ASTR